MPDSSIAIEGRSLEFFNRAKHYWISEINKKSRMTSEDFIVYLVGQFNKKNNSRDQK